MAADCDRRWRAGIISFNWIQAGTAIGLMASGLVRPTIEIASIGIPDTMFLMLLALVVFGPRRLPEIGRQIGKLMYEFRKVSNDFKFQMEEELRASEEAERQRKLAAEQAGRATLEAAPQPAAESAALELGTGAGEPEAAANIGSESAGETGETAPAVMGEVRGEPRKFPNIQPPASGDPVAAQKPFRERVEDVATESGDASSRELDRPVVVADEGRIGTEVQPGVDADMSARASHEAVAEAGSDKGQEVHHG
jgi:sec-independent protein translocase protein TatB